jgi:hypothetical protein
MPTVVDSSGWIEFFVGGSNADRFEKAIENDADCIGFPGLSRAAAGRKPRRECLGPYQSSPIRALRLPPME